MYPQENIGRTVAAVGAMTVALHARNVLNAAGIAAEVVSLLPKETRKGCAFGVAFSSQYDSEARRVLRAARIGISQFLRKDTG
ncbi:MAG: DUF3343 domain-containing protein [Clostridia bacterium]|nr:DUF3343 domain-containing protein [Clostridia bacterium]